MTPVEWRDLVVVGRVARPHGRRGEVIVDPQTDFLESRFQVGSVLYAVRGGRVERVRIREVRFHRGRPIIGLEGIDTISDAETFDRSELRVPEEGLHALPEGRYYHHELVGCGVVTRQGAPVGVVTSVDEGPGPSRLVIRDASGADVAVPLVAAICVLVDPARRRIVIDPPEGLLELNALDDGRA